MKNEIESQEIHRSLEEKFQTPERIELAHGTVQVYDLAPENVKTETPTVVAPGWAVTSETWRENILALAHSGRRVIASDSPHGIEVPETSEEQENIPEAELRKIAALIETLNEKGIEKVDVVAHSEAGLYVALAASLYPEKFRNLVLVDPAGIVGKDHWARLSTGFLKDIGSEIVRGVKNKKLLGPITRSFKDAQKSVLKNPLMAIRQVLAMSEADIHETLAALRERGVGISIIHAVDDKAFPMERVQKVVNTDQVDGFYSVRGTHNEIFLQPEKYSRLVDQALDALEAKQGHSPSEEE